MERAHVDVDDTHPPKCGTQGSGKGQLLLARLGCGGGIAREGVTGEGDKERTTQSSSSVCVSWHSCWAGPANIFVT